jgi:hypothetical protein
MHNEYICVPVWIPGAVSRDPQGSGLARGAKELQLSKGRSEQGSMLGHFYCCCPGVGGRQAARHNKIARVEATQQEVAEI